MVKRCVVGNCNNSNAPGSTMHLFPRDRTYRQKWERFVRQGRAHWTHATPTSVICGAHFVTPDDFDGYQQWSMGYKRQLDLKKGAIPTKMSICESKSTSLSELLRRSVAIVSHFTRGVGATCGSVFNWWRHVAAETVSPVLLGGFREMLLLGVLFTFCMRVRW